MPEVSDADLDAIREDNQRLRDKIAAAQAKREEIEAARVVEVTATQLMAENARLEAELAILENTSKVGAVRAGSDELLATAQADLKAAEAGEGLRVPLPPVDTTLPNPPKNTTDEVIPVDETKKDGSN